MAQYVEDYAPYTAGTQLRVGASAEHGGKALFAAEGLPAGTELLEELPLVAWPTAASATAGGFCDACLAVTDGLTPCAYGSGAHFCGSARCADGVVHRALCRGGGLSALRQWQLESFGGSQYGAESVARCNARIATDTAYFCSLGLPADVALLNAQRPFERLCAFPPGCELALGGGLTADELARVLRKHTRRGLLTELCTRLPAAEAEPIADSLLSAPHVAGLLQRLLLNSLATKPHRGAAHGSSDEPKLRFAGVFLLTACANHSCAPNVKVEATDEGSLRLRTTSRVEAGDELRISYIDTTLTRGAREKRLAHWAIDACACTRCRDEDERPAAAEGTAGVARPLVGEQVGEDRAGKRRKKACESVRSF